MYAGKSRGLKRSMRVATSRFFAFCGCITFLVSACFVVQSGVGQATSGATEHPARSGAKASRTESKAVSTISFRDISREAGLTTVPHSSTDRRYIVETMGGGGIALFDCDNDGKLDIAVVNDTTIDRYLAGGDPMVTLYHQDGSGETFTSPTSPRRPGSRRVAGEWPLPLVITIMTACRICM